MGIVPGARPPSSSPCGNCAVNTLRTGGRCSCGPAPCSTGTAVLRCGRSPCPSSWVSPHALSTAGAPEHRTLLLRLDVLANAEGSMSWPPASSAPGAPLPGGHIFLARRRRPRASPATGPRTGRTADLAAHPSSRKPQRVGPVARRNCSIRWRRTSESASLAAVIRPSPVHSLTQRWMWHALEQRAEHSTPSGALPWQPMM